MDLRPECLQRPVREVLYETRSEFSLPIRRLIHRDHKTRALPMGEFGRVLPRERARHRLNTVASPLLLADRPSYTLDSYRAFPKIGHRYVQMFLRWTSIADYDDSESSMSLETHALDSAGKIERHDDSEEGRDSCKPGPDDRPQLHLLIERHVPVWLTLISAAS